MFELDGVLWDSALHAIADSKDGKEVYYRLPDISDVSIDVSADTKDSVDKNGAIIKRSYTAKTATVTLTNTHLVLGAYAGTTGSNKVVADTGSEIDTPKMILIDPPTADAEESKKYTLPDTPIGGTVSVTPIYKDGGTGKSYTMDTQADTAKFAISEKEITLPTCKYEDTDIVQLLIKYEYKCAKVVMVENHADKFPKTVRLTIVGLYYAPCEKDVLRLGYIVFPSFQPSPETTIAMKNDSTFDYKGDAQSDYCAKKKRLFYMVFPEDDTQKDED